MTNWPSSVDLLGDKVGQLKTGEAIRQFIFAGNATFTVRSKKTGTRYTFKATRPDTTTEGKRPTWIKLLNGAQNETDYTFLGTVWGETSLTYNHSTKSRVRLDAPSVIALRWVLRALDKGDDKLFDQCEVWHEGRCGRCGRKLTVPTSIESGFGPECIGHLAIPLSATM